jgi:hypothetical protein
MRAPGTRAAVQKWPWRCGCGARRAAGAGGYLHPQGTEEVYELLGADHPGDGTGSPLEHVDITSARNLSLLDAQILARLAWHERGGGGIPGQWRRLNNSNIGMVYVATRRPQYVGEAFLSAHSARDFAPDLPITLFTDLPHLALARSPCFSQVVPIETRRSYRNLWGEGQLDRIRSLRKSPYDYTLHLDTDTRVLTPEFMELFRKLDTIDVGMAICQPDVSRCAQVTGLPMFNVGFILFRRSEPALQLLQAWEERTQGNFELGNLDEVPQIEGVRAIDDPEVRRELLFMDQTSFVQLLSPTVNRFGVVREIMDEPGISAAPAQAVRSTGP